MNTLKTHINHFHFDKVQDISGFSMINVEKGNYSWMLTRSTTHSDKSEFYRYVEQLSNPFFINAQVFPDCVYQFLIIIHKDLSAELYINDFTTAVECMTKRDKKKFEMIASSDIADIRRLKFPDIKIVKTDKVIYCFKVHWKFGLFFDLDGELDVDVMALTLGSLYRYLLFQNVFDLFSTGTQFKEMMEDGWFPFIEIIGNEYKILSDIYQNKFHLNERIEEIVESFNRARIESMTNKWWRNQIFKNKKAILSAGINAYLLNDSEGFINCLKTILGEIEGIMRLQYLDDTHNGKDIPIKDLLKYIIDKAKGKTGSSDSLFLPVQFLEYLENVVFAHFNLETGKVKLSRHSVGHGVAKTEDYTKSKALQAILVLDQIYFYLQK